MTSVNKSKIHLKIYLLNILSKPSILRTYQMRLLRLYFIKSCYKVFLAKKVQYFLDINHSFCDLLNQFHCHKLIIIWYIMSLFMNVWRHFFSKNEIIRYVKLRGHTIFVFAYVQPILIMKQQCLCWFVNWSWMNKHLSYHTTVKTAESSRLPHISFTLLSIKYRQPLRMIGQHGVASPLLKRFSQCH